MQTARITGNQGTARVLTPEEGSEVGVRVDRLEQELSALGDHIGRLRERLAAVSGSQLRPGALAKEPDTAALCPYAARLEMANLSLKGMTENLTEIMEDLQI